MEEDLNLDIGYRFNWALSIFYIIYLLVEVPSNILLKWIGPRYYLPGLVVGFGFVSMCTAFVNSFEGLCVARAFLGEQNKRKISCRISASQSILKSALP